MMRRWLLLVVLSALLAGVTPAPAWAKDATASEGKAGEGEETHKPDPFGRALDLGIYTVIVFLVLLFILTRFAWKPILHGLEERERNIASAVEESRKAREEAVQLRHDLEEVRQKGYAEINALIQTAREDAEKLKEQRRAEAEAEIQANRERLRREIALAHDQALQDVWKQTTDLATMVSSKVVRRQLSPDDHRALIDEAIADLQTAAADARHFRAAGEHEHT
jgi:F-type H+-transporting ATPase subunit b